MRDSFKDNRIRRSSTKPTLEASFEMMLVIIVASVLYYYFYYLLLFCLNIMLQNTSENYKMKNGYSENLCGNSDRLFMILPFHDKSNHIIMC